MKNTDNNTNESAKVETKESHEGMKVILSYLHDVVFLIAIVMILFSFCFRVVVVSGASMNTTLYNGDCLFVLGKVFYSQPKRGDIIVVSKDSFRDGDPIIKRIIATSGDVVDIRSGVVYVNDEALDEPYINSAVTNAYDASVNFPLVVQEGCVFALGDNRENSTDSRSSEIGMIDEREILGKAMFLLFPGKAYNGRDFSRMGGLAN